VLSRVIEAAGIATVSLSLVREHTEKIKAPRALFVPFPYGLAVGHPGDAVQQRSVLDAAFAMLDEPAGPVLRDYPDDERDESGAPIQASQVERTPVTMDLATEVTAMRRYWEQWAERTQRTGVGVSGVKPERFRGTIRFLEAFARGEETDSPDRPAGVSKLEFIRLSVLDLRTLYVEARLVTHPHESSDDRQRWFWGETALGDFIRRLADTMNASSDPAVKDAAFGIAR
jgi:hypothetical protein